MKHPFFKETTAEKYQLLGDFSNTFKPYSFFYVLALQSIKGKMKVKNLIENQDQKDTKGCRLKE